MNDYKAILTRIVTTLGCETFKEGIVIRRNNGTEEVETLNVEVQLLIQHLPNTVDFRGTKVCDTSFDKSLSDEDIMKELKTSGDLERTTQMLYYRAIEGLIHYSLTRKENILKNE